MAARELPQCLSEPECTMDWRFFSIDEEATISCNLVPHVYCFGCDVNDSEMAVHMECMTKMWTQGRVCMDTRVLSEQISQYYEDRVRIPIKKRRQLLGVTDKKPLKRWRPESVLCHFRYKASSDARAFLTQKQEEASMMLHLLEKNKKYQLYIEQRNARRGVSHSPPIA